MAGYKPLYIRHYESGLVQNRQDFILPDDAYPSLVNMFVWREQIRRRQGLQYLARLQRILLDESLGNSGASTWSFNIFSQLGITGETNAQISPGTVEIYINSSTITGAITGYTNSSNCEVFSSTVGLSPGDEVNISGVNVVPGSGDDTINNNWTAVEVFSGSFKIAVDSGNWGVYSSGGTWTKTTGSVTLIDQGNGILATNPVSSVTGTIEYNTGNVTITGAPSGQPTSINFTYFPNLPVMGIRTQEVPAINNENTIIFDTKYAYQINSGIVSELPSSTATTWTGSNSNFFFSTNYWVDSTNNKLFWVTNFSGANGDPIRYYDGTTWTDFTPVISGTDVVAQSLAILPFRGRLLLFNTREGVDLASSKAYYQRIRWSQIGDPLAADAWKDDMRGKGGFLDIPTSENITAVGFVRDNLVIYCERSTWQLRYTGRSIAPFQIERVNAELGATSAFSAVQFDTSLVGIGDKGIVECDSYASKRIDIKIPDLVFQFSNSNSGPQRTQGIRDIQQRVAYWSYVDNQMSKDQIAQGGDGIFPNRRLVYNYENDSWAIFTDSITSVGTYQPTTGIKWKDAKWPWSQAKYPWRSRPSLFPALIGGNQQGFLFYLGSNLTPVVTNQKTLTITNITGNNTTPTVITSPNHNLVNGQVIKIEEIATGTDFENLNGQIFSVILVNANSFQLWLYNPNTKQFTTPQTDSSSKTFKGYGVISLLDNIKITSKKFNFLDQGQNIQMGYIDLLMNKTSDGAITMNVYMNYDDNQPVNQPDENQTLFPDNPPDDFFNTIVPTTQGDLGGMEGSRYWQRVYCSVRGAFITLEFVLSNEQMIGVEQGSDVQINSQILWIRPGGRLQSW